MAIARGSAAAVLALVACVPLPLRASSPGYPVLEGVVVDGSGAPLSGADVRLTAGSSSATTRTDARGRFVLELPDGEPISLSVEMAGFRRSERTVARLDIEMEVKIALEPAPVTEKLVVTARRGPARLGDTAASVVVISRDDLESSAAPTVDGVLRHVPGFALFRRSGSRTANPTAQGVSLRGTGASGASRAIVLADGVPLNDPFGGWVYWGRVPRASLERVEVMRGGASDVWGSGALSGAIQLVRRETDLPAVIALDASGGSQGTNDASLFSALRMGAYRASFSAEALTTDGYVPIEPDSRGSVDVEAGSRRAAAELALERRDGSGRLFVRGSLFDEDRENGTPLQVNDTRLAHVSVGGDRHLPNGSLSLRAWGSDQSYNQSFSAVSTDRGSERLTRLQAVPSDALGLGGEWRASFGSHALTAGLEGRRVRGESREEVFGAASRSFITAGGEEISGSLFLEDVFAAGERASLTGTLRLDSRENRNGRLSTRASASADPVSLRFGDRHDTAWSPRLAFLYRAGSSLTLSASAYRSFRAPSLNELYRSFRVGNVETLANEGLDAERLSGIEGGAMLSSGRVFLRTTAFWMEIDDAIANVTLEATPTLITRQRENLGRIRSRGVELDLESRLGRSWKLSAGYLFVDSAVTAARAAPELVGLRTPQVARHQGSFELSFEDPRIVRAALQARWLGRQFEDDQNRLPLDPSLAVDVFLSRAVIAGLDAFVAAENVFDERSDVGRTPVRTIGPPRALRAGLRLRLPGEFP
jgi:outer membrane receptor protein involved in Fe transport